MASYKKHGVTGRLKHRITFQQQVRQDDGSGGSTFEWEDYYTCSAQVRPLKGSRKLEENQTQLVGASEFLIRHSHDKVIDEKMRIVFRGWDYVINMPPVDIEERGRMVQIIATKKI